MAEDVLNTIVEDDLMPLFDGFRLTKNARGQSSAPRLLLTGRVELTSARVRGSVGVCGSRAALAQTAPLAGVDPEDWVGELANLAAGRLKYGLLSRQRLRLTQSTPSVTSGSGVPPVSATTRVLTLRSPKGSIQVWLQLDGPLEGDAMGGRGLSAGQSMFFE